MHLAVDSVGAKSGGGAEVLLSFLRSAVADDRIAALTVFTSPRSVRQFDLPAARKLQERPQPQAEPALGRVWWYERGLAQEIWRVRPDALLCMNGAGLAPAAFPRFALVQQSLGFSREALRTLTRAERLRVSVHHALMRRGCASATRVLTQTSTMCSWVAREFSIPMHRIEVVGASVPVLPPPEMPSPALEPMRAARESARVLYAGSSAGYKNLSTLTRAMPEIRRRIPHTMLFVTTDRGSIRGEGVVEVGFLGRGALREAYELATLLVMPSLVETVGLPMLEAMSTGTPIVAADRPYAREICGDAAIYFDPASAGDLASTVTRLLSDREMQLNLRSRGKERLEQWSIRAPEKQMLACVCGARAA